MGVRIEEASPEDDAWIITRHDTLYRAEFGFDERFGQGIAKKMQTIRGKADPFTRIWIAWTGDARSGSICIWPLTEDTAFLNFVLVEPGFRGQGIAETLLQTALTHARDHGMRKVRLETYDCLQSARRLYARHGFQITESVAGQKRFGQLVEQEFWERRL